MPLWMVAEHALYEKLLRAGELVVDPALMSWRDEPDFVAAYDWMRSQMYERIAGYGGGYPWWAWARRGSEVRPPDLRERGSFHTWPPGTRLVRLKLDVPDAKVLLSDFAAWGCVLNRHIVADTEAEFERWMALAEVDEGAARDIARATWARVFDLRRDAADPAWNGPGPAQDVQACFETLRARDVRRVTHYRARPTKEWLAAEARAAGEC